MNKKRINKVVTVLLIITCLFSATKNLHAQVPDSEQGLRAEWMRGALGLLWLPERTFNGNIEGVTIDDFITQIKDLRTIDFVQLPLTSPNIFSPTHTGPHPIIEGLWDQDADVDADGNPINLVVPRSVVEDPLLSWLEALRAAGLRTEIYVNSYNLLARYPADVQVDYPDVSQRWMDYCDTDPTIQAFIKSQNYHTNGGDNRRVYMFCYAEFILKEYAKRYGDLIDAWCFDSADNIMEDECGDHPDSENVDDQRIYQAFANACHEGNPNAAISFNNSVGDRTGNPFTTATLFEDYTFGHPFGGAGDMVENATLYGYNYGVIEYMRDTNGYAFRDDTRSWNDNVVGHFFPKQSTTSWNAGSTPCLTDDEFVEWTTEGIINGGAITWGTPLVRTNLENSPELTLQPYALTQFELTDAYLKEFQSPGKPNWSRQYTILPPAYLGKLYSHTLTEGFDVWDPEGDVITSILAQGNLPSWLKITKTATGVWTLSGTPTETADTDYEFDLQAISVSGATNRTVELNVYKEEVTAPTTLDVEIKATADTNYGVGAVATMYSEEQTAPDGLATFKISIDVTPSNSHAVTSGASGGSATANSWGLGTGGNATSDFIFTGSDNEWVESINNIKIVDFSANGGTYTEANLISKFISITVVNSHSTKDYFSIRIGTKVSNPGKLANPVEVVDLESETFLTDITDFAIGTGNTETTNKWSVEGVTVMITFDDNLLSVSDETKDNANVFNLYPNPTQHTIHLSSSIHSVQIIDITGKVVKTFSEETKQLDVSQLNSGLYFLKGFSSDGILRIKKFIKNALN
ncbi:T9SS type A sorting domain-containing protein [Tamlana sp. 1_MG-2023]|uniref:T9SS type A sorting domain-containing protein n=1 Tax=Tamlana sp. 1_MG-2023 TaxID=3062628 RepID=UPI0026E4222A|nr:T9SS type A sorting domain-containing protein [Tamlana sp. 1_MG-2023]MDO6792596.1 T9SS type A sorting domain-containing protein [Tamlana sp. 1_MG-2023]